MALLSELVKIVAEVEGLDEVSVGIFARHAREAGHITQGGRGRAAAKMNIRDAANLLIAVNACALAKDVAGAIPLFRSLPVFGLGSDDDEIGRSGATFGEDLEKVLSLFGGFGRLSAVAEMRQQVRIYFERPIPLARIRLPRVDESGMKPRNDRQYAQAPNVLVAAKGDRSDRTTITTSTIVAVAEALQT